MQQLADHAVQLNQWAELPEQAERHGLAPLVYHHLQQAGVVIPRSAKGALQGLYLRHRHTNQVRSQMVAEIAAALDKAGIQVLTLKGIALAHLVYGQAGLRPMRDLDLLVKRADLLKAREILVQLGFDAPDAGQRPVPDKHLDNATRQAQGFSSSVELHYNLFNRFAPATMTLETIHALPLQFECAGVPISTLGPEDMLLHLCEHLAYHASIWEPIRFIWLADVVGFAEKFVDQIDWDFVRRRYAIVVRQLSLFHHVCPLSEQLVRASRVKLGPPPQGIGEEFAGWPRYLRSDLKGKPPREILRATFFPSEWWLRLHYRLDSVQPLLLYRWFFHPFYILGPFYALEKLKLFWHLKLRPTLGA